MSCGMSLFCVLFKSMYEHQTKWHPPDHIVRENGPSHSHWKSLFPDSLKKTNRTKYFSKKSHQDYRPMPNRIRACDGIPHTIHPDNHPNALPEFRIDRHWLKCCPLKNSFRKQNGPTSPRNIVQGCCNKDERHPLWRYFVDSPHQLPSGSCPYCSTW